MPSSEVQKVVRLYQAYVVFVSVFIWLPIYYTYQKLNGLTDAEYFQIQSLYYLMVFAFEIPTGFFADKVGYKRTLTIAAVTLAVSNLLAIFSTNYWGFLIHFGAVALARALASGAMSAYLYEFLKKHDAKSEYKKIEGSARYYSLLLRTVGWSVVGYAMDLHMTLPYWMALAICVFAILSSLMMPEQGAAMEEKTTLFESLKPIPSILVRTRGLMILMFLGVGIFVLSRLSMVNLYQPMMTDKGFNLAAFGWVLGIMAIVEAFAAKHSHRLSKWVSDLTGAYLGTLLVCLGLVVVIFSKAQVLIIFGFILFSIGFGAAFPMIRQLMNDIIPDSRYRATILSVESMLNRIVCAGAAAAAGFYVDQGKMWFFMMGLVGISAALVTFITIRLHYLRLKSAY